MTQYYLPQINPSESIGEKEFKVALYYDIDHLNSHSALKQKYEEKKQTGMRTVDYRMSISKPEERRKKKLVCSFFFKLLCEITRTAFSFWFAYWSAFHCAYHQEHQV